jgi:hypothetical protein
MHLAGLVLSGGRLSASLSERPNMAILLTLETENCRERQDNCIEECLDGGIANFN